MIKPQELSRNNVIPPNWFLERESIQLTIATLSIIPFLKLDKILGWAFPANRLIVLNKNGPYYRNVHKIWSTYSNGGVTSSFCTDLISVFSTCLAAPREAKSVCEKPYICSISIRFRCRDDCIFRFSVAARAWAWKYCLLEVLFYSLCFMPHSTSFFHEFILLQVFKFKP